MAMANRGGVLALAVLAAIGLSGCGSSGSSFLEDSSGATRAKPVGSKVKKNQKTKKKTKKRKGTEQTRRGGGGKTSTGGGSTGSSNIPWAGKYSSHRVIYSKSGGITHFVVNGKKLCPLRMLHSGSASYSGESRVYVNDVPIDGKTSLGVNFAGKSLSGSFGNFAKDGSDVSGKINISGGQIVGSSIKANLKGSIDGKDVAGHLKGGFYGSRAREIGGVISTNKGNGLFSARKN
jgi:hypothetical protein